ncbi:AT-rich interactive domain-containing protein 1B-like isoform X4 [Lineus longissimus]|uniref:AT-rich interactive domain-containing protein 1B-like isoform X4 n=1 Tax=Lineus longissimus TaxID=88925 RepID=UPI00315D8B96
MATMNSDEHSDNLLVNKKIKSEPNLGPESNIMDSVQDGGQKNMMKSEPTANDVPPNLDGPSMKSEMNDFSQNMGDQNIANDSFNRMNENMPSSQMSNYNSSFVRGNYMPDQHGGPGSGNADINSQNSPYNQFGPQGMRTGYPPSSKGPMMPNRPGMSGAGMNMMPPNYSHGPQQRYMSGQSISQQGGPTPTLNQLLQNSSSSQQRYSNFNDYVSSQNSMNNDTVANMSFSGGQNWGGQRPQMSGNYPNPMQPGMSNNPAFRNQQRPIFDPNQRRPGMPPNYPQQQQGGPGPYGPGQQQYPGANSSRFPSTMQPGQQPNRPGQIGMPNQMPGQSFGQQVRAKLGSQFNQQASQQPSFGQPSQSFMQQTPSSQAQPAPGSVPTSSQQPSSGLSRSSTPVSQTTSPPQNQSASQSPAQQSHFMQQPQQNPQPLSPSQGFGNGTRNQNKQVVNQDGDLANELPTNADDINSDSNSSGGARSTPTSTAPQHLSVGVLRPSRSPSVGSTGSRSNTPASITGNQAGSPMPPRPPSSHVDGPNQMNQTPMANQGFGGQMMPPPGGHNQMNFGGKMHPGMMPGQQMAPYSQHNSQFPQQGNFPRSQSPGGMQGYGGQQNSFSNANQMGPNHMFPGGMGGSRSMPPGYPGNSFNQSGMNSMGMNNQYGNFNSHGYSGSGPGPNGPMPNQMNSMNSSHMNNVGLHNQGGMQDSASSGLPSSQSVQSGRIPGHSGMPNSGGPGMPSNVSGPGMPSNSGPGMHMNSSGPGMPSSSSGPGMHSNSGPGMSHSGPVSSNSGPGIPGSSNGPVMSGSGAPGMSGSGGPGMPSNGPSMPGSGGPGVPMNGPSMPGAGGPMPGQMGMHGPGGMSGQRMPAEGMPGMPAANTGMPNNQRMPGPGGIKGAQAAADAALQAAATLAHRQQFSRSPGMGQQSPRMFTPQQQQQPNMNFNSSSQNPGVNQVMPNHMSGGQMHTLNQLQAQVNSVDSGSRPTPSTTPVPNCMSVSSSGSPLTSHMEHSGGENSNSGDALGNMSVSSTSVTQSITTPVTSIGDMLTATTPMSAIAAELMNHDSNSSQSTLVMEDTGVTQEKVKRFQDALSASHPPTPIAPSPATSMTSFPDELENISSPSWPGTPVSTTDRHQITHKSGSLTEISRLYEMGDEPDRRAFLDHYLAFVEERGAPLNAIPTISKQPVDLFKMYLAVKERGGVLEVTKAKKWKEISLAINMGGSASAAYTCRKNYMKHMLATECKLDRGNCDPGPILAQLEQVVQSNKKEGKKSRVPSPASSHSQNSQDAFRPPSLPNTHMDPFAAGGQRPPSMPNDMGMAPHMAGPPGPMGMMPNSNMPNSGECVSVQDPFSDDAVSNQFPRASMGPQMPGFPMNQQPPQSQQGPTPPTQGPNMGNNFMFNNRTSMNAAAPPYSSSGPQQMNSYGNANNASSQGEQFSGEGFPNRPMGPNNFQQRMPTPEGFSGQPGYGNRMPNQQSQGQFPFRPAFDRERMDQQMMPGQSLKPTPPPSQGPMPPTSMSSQPSNEQFPNRFGSPQVRPPQDMNQPQFSGPNQPANFSGPRPPFSGPGGDGYQQFPNQQPTNQPPAAASPNLQGPMFPGGQKPPNQQRDMFNAAQKRFPDFEKKDGYSGPPPAYNRVGSYPSYSSGPRPGMMGPMDSTPGPEQGRWPPQMPPRYPSQHSGPPFSSGPPGMMPNTPSMPHAASFPPRNQRMSPHRDKGFSPGKMQPQQHMSAQYHPQKKEITFPPESIEAIQPLLGKRKKMTSKDIGPVEAWRLMMALKSGMLAECTWALDTLSVLLYDDTTVAYFGLAKMPGLVDCLIEHFRQCLIRVFDGEFSELEVGYEKVKSREERVKERSNMERAAKRLAEEKSRREKRRENAEESDLNELSEMNEDEGATECLEVFKMPENLDQPGNYTLITKKGKEVIIEEHSVNEDLILDDKSWDVHSDFESSAKWWDYGRGDMTTHLVTRMESQETNNVLRRAFFGPKNCEYLDSEADSPVVKKSLPIAVMQELDTVLNASIDTTSEIKTEPVETPVLESETKNTSENSEIEKVTIKMEPMDTEESETNCSDMPTLEKESESSKETESLKEEDCANLVKQENIIETVKSEENDSSESKTEASAEKCSSVVENGEVVSDNAETVDDNAEKVDDGAVKTEFDETDAAEVKREPSGGEAGNEIVEKKVDYSTKLEILVPEVDLSFCNDSFCGDDTPEVTPGGLKRKRNEYEEESYHRDEPPLYMTTAGDEEIAKRCLCISNIFRSLSFVPGNDAELAKHKGLIFILGKLLLLHHRHPVRSRVPARFERDDIDLDDLADVTFGQEEWWWKHLTMLRENTMVIFANMAGHLNLATYPEDLCLPLLDGLLHWAVCPSSTAQDPFPNLPTASVLSPHRLILETLCKLCIHEANVDLLLATPPFSRIVNLFSILTKHLSDKKDQVLREFAIVLLSYLVQGDSSAARAVALQHPSVSLLLDFVETAEQSAMQVASMHGVDMLRGNPDMMGTSLDMLRRAAMTLLHIARVPENRNFFIHNQSRLLTLVLSQILDQHVAQILADVLYECSRSDDTPPQIS